MTTRPELTPRLMTRRIVLGFIVATVMIASGFIISLYSYNQYSKDIDRAQHTYEVTSTLERILSLMKDVETGSRGYVISNDKAYLEPYTVALRLLPEQINQLRRLANNNRVQIQRRVRLEQLIRAKLAVTKIRNTISIADQQNMIVSGRSKQTMDAIRQHVAVMIETEHTIMDMRNKQVARSFRHTLILIFALSLLTFLALAVSYRLLNQELARRQSTEDQLRQYEQQLREQIRQLEASNEELERFAFVASHDLQEPLRKIQSFSNLITERYTNLFDNDSLVFIGKISKSAERMAKLIKDLLNFSRISSHRETFSAVPLNDIVQRILDDQELRIKGLNVHVEVGPLPVVPGVTGQIDHLFNNLISNALKFIRPGVQPRLRIRARTVDGQAYEGLNAERPYYEITVEDNGIGFDEKYIDHIFRIFQRLHSKTTFEGTGIGLAICKRVVMYHQGYITARSQLNQGTTFIVVLPQSQSLQQHDRATSSETYSYPLS